MQILIFVNQHENCDILFRDLLKHGYPCLSLHGRKDQTDRESTISDFKGDVCNLLVATSVAARGLDVRDLVLVLNYDVPNHHEDYVHRVGRTGRAGNKGTAITFISKDEEKYAPDLVKALRESRAPIPQVKIIFPIPLNRFPPVRRTSSSWPKNSCRKRTRDWPLPTAVATADLDSSSTKTKKTKEKPSERWNIPSSDSPLNPL